MRALFDRLLLVRRDEARTVAWSFAYFFFLLSSYFCLRPMREAIAVATGGEKLQYLFTGTFVTMLVLLPVFGWLVARFPKRIFLPAVYVFFLVNLLAFAAALGGDSVAAWVGWVYFVWISVFNLFIVSVFWSVMADLYSSEQGRRLFGVIAAGGSLGAIVGPLITAGFIDTLGRSGILVLAALLLGGAMVCMLRLLRQLTGDGEGAAPPIGGSIVAGATLVFRDRYLGALAAVILLTTLLQSFMYFMQTEIVGRHYGDADPTRFFAFVDLATNCISITLQLVITSRILGRFGVAVGLVIMPIVTALGFIALAVAPGVLVVGAVQALRRGGEYGLMKPARDLLYTRVDEERKYKSKNFIDTVVYRGGDVSSGWLYRGLNGGLRLPADTLAWLAVPVALVWGVLAFRLGRRFEARRDE